MPPRRRRVVDALCQGRIKRLWEMCRKHLLSFAALGKSASGRPVRQPRHFVLKKFEAWMKEQGLAFVAVEDVRRTKPAVAAYAGTLDFVVLRGEEKLLVTVRPHLLAKHIKALGELQVLFGSEYGAVRFWPSDKSGEWIWQQFAVEGH